MAKTLGPKSILIRQALKDHPDKTNKELAEFLTADAARRTDKITVTAQDVAAQKQALKVAGTMPKGKPGRKKGGSKATVVGSSTRSVVAPPGVTPKATNAVAVVGRVLEIAKECGGIKQLKQLVDQLAGIKG